MQNDIVNFKIQTRFLNDFRVCILNVSQINEICMRVYTYACIYIYCIIYYIMCVYIMYSVYMSIVHNEPSAKVNIFNVRLSRERF